MSSCSCTSGKNFEACCEPFLKGTRPPPTAEALMRSRYTAYALGDIEYVEKTTAPEGLHDFDRAGSEQWSKKAEWQGLEVLSTTEGGANDKTGVVEFIAKYRIENTDQRHHEVAEFRREKDGWLFVDGKIVREPFKHEGPKVGRNDPCTCGSGKKYKKCCGVNA